MPIPEEEIILGLKNSNQSVFDHLFREQYAPLCRYALKIVRNNDIAEEIVQDVFVSIWNRRIELNIETSLNAYLLSSVKYSCYNHLRKKNLTIVDTDLTKESFTEQFISDTKADSQITQEELQQIIQNGIHELPEKCQQIFSLSREIGLSNKEIATELDISIKTVENQMTIALQKLRKHVIKYWGAFILFIKILESFGGK